MPPLLKNPRPPQGKYEEAERLYKRAIAILEATLGDDHPNLASPRQTLGILLLSQQVRIKRVSREVVCVRKEYGVPERFGKYRMIPDTTNGFYQHPGVFQPQGRPWTEVWGSPVFSSFI